MRGRVAGGVGAAFLALLIPVGHSETKLLASDLQRFAHFGQGVAISGDTAIVGAPLQDMGASTVDDGEGAAYVFERAGIQTWQEIAQLTASDAQNLDQFGHAVAISGDTVLVGAPGEDGGEGDPVSDAGAAYVFQRDAGGPNGWGEVDRLPTPAAVDGAAGRSVAISGATAVVGAPGSEAAYVFEDVQGFGWLLITTLSAADSQTGDSFGGSVEISGDTVIVGARFEDGGMGDPRPAAGAAYLFGRDQGGENAWGQIDRLIATDSQAGDFFGESVAVSSDTAVVGASHEDGGPGDPEPEAGAAYVFADVQGFGWLQIARLAASDAQADDEFGASVAISGDVAIVGARFEDAGVGDPRPATGAAYVFRRDQGGENAWGESTKLNASDAAGGETFAESVAISGDTFIVGSLFGRGGSGDPPAPGAAYVYAPSFLEFFIAEVAPTPPSGNRSGHGPETLVRYPRP